MSILITLTIGILGAGLLGYVVAGVHFEARVSRAEHARRAAEAECRRERLRNRLFYRAEPVVWSNIDALMGRATAEEES